MHKRLNLSASLDVNWLKIGCEFRVGCEANANRRSRWMVFVHLSLCVSFLTLPHHFRCSQETSISPVSLAHECYNTSFHLLCNYSKCFFFSCRVLLLFCHYQGTNMKVCIFSFRLNISSINVHKHIINNDPNLLGSLKLGTILFLVIDEYIYSHRERNTKRCQCSIREELLLESSKIIYSRSLSL